MQDQSEITTSARRIRSGVIRIFLKVVPGAVAVFVIAAIVAPALFDQRNDLMAAAAFGLWLLCPLIVFLVGCEVFAEWKRMTRRPRS
jgi:uncharacterized membrane protein (GlpM family)